MSKLLTGSPPRYRTARGTWQALQSRGAGPFIAYQIMQDLRWVLGPYSDEQTWCYVGAGAWQGHLRLTEKYTPVTAGDSLWTPADGIVRASHARLEINKMPRVRAQGDVEPAVLSTLQKSLAAAREALGPHMNMFEIEHNLCEFDKYERIRTREGAGRKFSPRPGLPQ